jgi:hypothetical protein
MIVLSFNARGVGGTPKVLSLKRLVSDNMPSFVMVQKQCAVVQKQQCFSQFSSSLVFLHH